MATFGHNDGFRMLDEFACEAIPGTAWATPGSPGRGVNTGLEVAAELDGRASSPSVTKERLAAFRAMSSAELLALVRGSGSKLTSEELLAIHDIAAERWPKGDDGPSQRAMELSREAMRVAISRTA